MTTALPAQTTAPTEPFAKDVHGHAREQLTVGTGGYDHIGDGRSVDVPIARLRHRLGAAHRHRIVTVRRVDYRYVPDQHPNTPSYHRP